MPRTRNGTNIGARLTCRRAPGRLVLEPSFGVCKPGAVALPQILMADALRTREQRIVELHRIEMKIAFHILEPFGRIARRVLQSQHLEPPLILIALEGRLHGRLAVQIARQGDGALP